MAHGTRVCPRSVWLCFRASVALTSCPSRPSRVQRLDLMLNATAKSGGVYLYANQQASSLLVPLLFVSYPLGIAGSC